MTAARAAKGKREQWIIGAGSLSGNRRKQGGPFPWYDRRPTGNWILLSTNFRPQGIALGVIIILFMIGASSAAYFRRFPLPTDPLEQLKLIANDRFGQSFFLFLCWLSRLCLAD